MLTATLSAHSLTHDEVFQSFVLLCPPALSDCTCTTDRSTKKVQVASSLDASCSVVVLLFAITLVDSLVPRPHTLMRRNGEPSQISWASMCFCNSEPSNVQNITQKTRSKEVRILEWR